MAEDSEAREECLEAGGRETGRDMGLAVCLEDMYGLRGSFAEGMEGDEELDERDRLVEIERGIVGE